MKYVLIGVVGFVCLIVFILLILGLFIFIKKTNNIPIKNILSNKKLENVNRIYFSYSCGNYMDGSVKYELKCEEDQCTLTYKGNQVPEEEQKEYSFDSKKIDEIVNQLNEYEVYKWDGFRGSDLHVLDGHSFTLWIKGPDKSLVDASGYESWPKNYQKVKGYLIGVFNEVIPEEDIRD